LAETGVVEDLPKVFYWRRFNAFKDPEYVTISYDNCQNAANKQFQENRSA